MYTLPKHSGAESDPQQKQLEQLLDGEHFEPVEFEDDTMKSIWKSTEARTGC